MSMVKKDHIYNNIYFNDYHFKTNILFRLYKNEHEADEIT